MIDNRSLVADLLAAGRLRSCVDPRRLGPPRGGAVSGERVAGMLLGLCIGDALGNTSESLPPARRREVLGEVRDYLPNRHAEGHAVGLPSDDTQLAYWTLAHLLKCGGLVPEGLAETFCTRGRIFGIGDTVRSFLAARASGAGWIDASQESAGNGALMRIAPVLLPHLRTSSTALWADALLAGAVTHNDFASNAACVGFVGVLWEALRAAPPVPQGFWLDRFVALARAVEGDEPRYPPRAPSLPAGRTSMWSLTDRLVRDALTGALPAAEACDRWYSGAFLLETVPSALYILEVHGNDPEEAIVRAVNDTRDNDTIAAVVGAAVGALHGAEALPRRWRDGLLGRTSEDDDGQVHALIERARAEFVGIPSTGPRERATRRTRAAFRGCLLGGAVGDALGAPVEFIRSVEEIRARFGPEGLTDFAPAYGRLGAITDDTQMMLFTAEALIRARHRWLAKGIAFTTELAYHAYLRWLSTQGRAPPCPTTGPVDSGWLASVRELHAERAPGLTCLDALASGSMGTTGEPLNDSKGCGGVMRVAPVGLAGARDVFRLGCDLAAITHGHRTGWLAAGYLATVVDRLAAGMELEDAARDALEPLRQERGHEETLASVEAALSLAHAGEPSADRVSSLGKGWVAEEALAIGLYCALVARDFAHGVLLAVNHGGDSDSTGSIAGNILGLLHGEEGVPARWRERLECREVIAEVADDLWLHFGDRPPRVRGGEDDGPAQACELGDWEKYPGR